MAEPFTNAGRIRGFSVKSSLKNGKNPIPWPISLDGKEIAKRIISVFPGKTQREIGETVGRSQDLISGWLHRKSKPTLEQVVLLAERSGKSVDWILYGDEKKARAEPEQKTADAFRSVLSAPPPDCPNGGLCALLATLLGQLMERVELAADDHDHRDRFLRELANAVAALQKSASG
jgi:transcriptional regulator with XRE-family HTH domain